MDPKRKFITIILLKQQSNKVIPNDILLYPLIRAWLKPHQKKCFLQ